MNTIRERAPERGAHVRVLHYSRGSVRHGTHTWADLSFTGTVRGSVRDGAAWVAVTPDRALTVAEHLLLADAGARHITAHGDNAVIVPEATLDGWTFENIPGWTFGTPADPPPGRSGIQWVPGATPRVLPRVWRRSGAAMLTGDPGVSLPAPSWVFNRVERIGAGEDEDR